MLKRFGLVGIFSILITLAYNCTLIPSASGNNPEKSGGNEDFEVTHQSKAIYSEGILGVNAPYPFTLFSVYNKLSKEQLLAEYNDWKAHYVVSAGNGMLRVQRDAATDFDTVSEGMAYGMLLAVYFNDQATFDGLYKYVLAHSSGRPEEYGLMHWKVNKNGEDVSEFGIKVPHPRVWTNTNNGSIIASATKPAEIGWSPLSEYDRKYTSATDADADIALALAMAAKLWGSSANYNYSSEATKVMNSIITKDMKCGWRNTGELFLGNGYYSARDGNAYGTWGGIDGNKSGWNPSYFTPAWYRIFGQLSGNNQWSDLLEKVYNHMAIVENKNNGTGLFPDWVDTYTHTGVAERPIYCSDIYNYELSPPAPTSNMSYNFYYDAIRVGWRMAVEASWFGDPRAIKIAKQIAEFFKSRFYSKTIVDGYFYDGSPWRVEYKDALNTPNGGKYYTLPFIAMIACTTLVYGDYDYMMKFYRELVNKKDDYSLPNNYYGNTLRLLALLYLSGEFPNLYQGEISTGNTKFYSIPRLIQAENFESGSGITIQDDSTADGGKFVVLSKSSGWMKYRVEVLPNWLYNSCYFRIIFKYKTSTSGQTITLNLGNAQYLLNLQNTGGQWRTIYLDNIYLPLGKNIIFVQLSGSDICVDSISIERPSIAISIPGYFEAEDFNAQKDCEIFNNRTIYGTASDSYMEYRVNIRKSGYYNIISKANYYGGGHGVDIFNNGVKIGTMVYPTLWSYEGVVLNNIYLSEGNCVLRVNILNAPRNIDYFNFKLISTKSIPGRIEAEDYNTMSNANINYYGGSTNLSGGNAGTSYWVEYDVTVPVTRIYTLRYKVASPYYNCHKLSFATNGVIISTIDVPQSDWTIIQTTVNLQAGTYPVRIISYGGRYSFDWFELQ